MKLLLLGRTGQVGGALLPLLEPLGQVVAPGRAQADLSAPESLRSLVRECAPDVIVNAAAYTAVDKAESEPGLAHAVNAASVGVLAEEAAERNVLLVHYSTDYVFDGTKRTPYVEDDATGPLGVYGRTKLEGERAVLASGCRHVILRTSWVYASTGKNFLLTILRLASAGKPLRIVADQRGAPTTARNLARLTRDILQAGGFPAGIYHATAGGETTWHGFACEILRGTGSTLEVQPITTEEYPVPARRPAYSVLDNAKLVSALGRRMPDWQDQLREELSCLA